MKALPVLDPKAAAMNVGIEKLHVSIATQPQQASVSSWEHGLLRMQEIRTPKSEIRKLASRIRNPQSATRNFLVARGEADAPDIDGRIYAAGKLPVGEFVQVRVIGHTDYDLIAEPV